MAARTARLHFTSAVEHLKALERLLRANGVEPTGRTREACKTAEWLVARFVAGAPVPDEDRRDDLLFMLDQLHFARSILPLEEHRCFPALREHLVRLGRAQDPGQNYTVRLTDPHLEDNNKLFELLVAAAAMSFSRSVEVEPEQPPDGRPSNPDVILSFRRRRWGIACKAPDSFDRRGYLRNVKKGVNQLNRAGLGRGIVLINARHVFPHDQLMPFPYKKVTPDERDRVLDAFYQRLKQTVAQTARGLRALGTASNARVFLCHYIQGVHLDSESRMRPYVKLFFNNVDGWPSPGAHEAAFFGALNHALRW